MGINCSIRVFPFFTSTGMAIPDGAEIRGREQGGIEGIDIRRVKINDWNS